VASAAFGKVRSRRDATTRVLITPGDTPHLVFGVLPEDLTRFGATTPAVKSRERT